MAVAKKKSAEQLKDDDERTTSAGLFTTAEAYRLSALALEGGALWKAPKRVGHAEKPVEFLYSHAIELYLKALLRREHGVGTIQDKFGHNIKRLVKEAEKLGLFVTVEDRDVFALMADAGVLIEMRYIRTGPKPGPALKLEELRRTCKNVRGSVAGLLRETRSQD